MQMCISSFSFTGGTPPFKPTCKKPVPSPFIHGTVFHPFIVAVISGNNLLIKICSKDIW